MEKALKIAQQNGYKIPFNMEYLPLTNQRVITTDPFFWQALGKSLGWENKQHPHWRINIYPEYDSIVPKHPHEIERRSKPWEAQMHRLIDHLAEGKDIESFFNNLIDNK